MYRFSLTLEYDGTFFHGWQIQENVKTVQGSLLEALRKFDPCCQEVVGAGRTDTGVHATSQIAHVDLKKLWKEKTIQKAVNFYLYNHPISVLQVKLVDNSFHARFSATKRHYLYKIYSRETSLTFEKNQYWNIRYAQNEKKMRDAI
jgi:tRNA pseudouridine38-40 synthase